MKLNIDYLLNEKGWLNIVNVKNFDTIALLIYKYQYDQCAIYQAFSDAVGKNPNNVLSISEIPFLPISFFKTHQVICGNEVPELYFESSGTTSTINSKHYIKNIELYKVSFLTAFQQLYGAPSDYIFLCLLPSYLERSHSSLVFMAEELIKQSGHVASGFYLNEFSLLSQQLYHLKERKIFLLGVTFGLLDFATDFPMNLKDAIVMETGGMKGRREEWVRGQVHDFLKEQWTLPQVHSEYGMTELLSQAYAKKNGLFQTPPWMKVFARDENDPFEIRKVGSGGLNVIDLANLNSCSFIATEDLTKIHTDGSFEVLGRMDDSALRGCSLMIA